LFDAARVERSDRSGGVPFPLRATNYQPTNTYMMMENNNNTKEKRNQP
jgi:hypothetical protein